MAQKLFMELEDDLFVYEVGQNANVYKFNNIDLFDKLREEYITIKNIDNYKDVENRLYKDKSRREIVEFELVRIIDNLNNNEFVTSQLVNIEKLLKMYEEDIPDNVYKNIINLIIKIELMIDINIGLFVELCELFEGLNNKDIDEISSEEDNKMEN